MSANYELFLEQINNVVNKNPHFKIFSSGDKEYLKGILAIPNDDGEVIGDFLIEIHISEGFPNSFPILFEVGGQIPNLEGWHKYPNHSCCLTVPADELLLCKNGITVERFIQSQAIPFFANYIHCKLTGNYKNGDYSHGKKGNFEYYENLLGTKDQKKWIEYFQFAFGLKKHNFERNQKCICDSGKKFKNCHDLVFYKLKLIGKENVINQLK